MILPSVFAYAYFLDLQTYMLFYKQFITIIIFNEFFKKIFYLLFFRMNLEVVLNCFGLFFIFVEFILALLTVLRFRRT